MWLSDGWIITTVEGSTKYQCLSCIDVIEARILNHQRCCCMNTVAQETKSQFASDCGHFVKLSNVAHLLSSHYADFEQKTLSQKMKDMK